MAKTIEQIQEEVQQIKNETVAKQNTATRVGGALEDMVEKMEADSISVEGKLTNLGQKVGEFDSKVESIETEYEQGTTPSIEIESENGSTIIAVTEEGVRANGSFIVNDKDITNTYQKEDADNKFAKKSAEDKVSEIEITQEESSTQSITIEGDTGNTILDITEEGVSVNGKFIVNDKDLTNTYQKDEADNRFANKDIESKISNIEETYDPEGLEMQSIAIETEDGDTVMDITESSVNVHADLIVNGKNLSNLEIDSEIGTVDKDEIVIENDEEEDIVRIEEDRIEVGKDIYIFGDKITPIKYKDTSIRIYDTVPSFIANGHQTSTNKIVNSVAYQDGTIFCATSEGNLIKIDDNGNESTLLTLSNATKMDWRMMYIDADGNVYASPHAQNGSMQAIDRGLYKLTKGGNAFIHVLSLYDPASADPMVAEINDDTVWTMCQDIKGNLYAGIYSHTLHKAPRLYKSTDRGDTWFLAYDFLQIVPTAKHVHCVIYNPYNDALYAICGEINKILKSVNGGTEWVDLQVKCPEGKGTAMIAVKDGVIIGSDMAYSVIMSKLYADDKTVKETGRAWANVVFATRRSDTSGNIYAFCKIDDAANVRAYMPPFEAITDPSALQAWKDTNPQYLEDWEKYYDFAKDLYPEDCIVPTHFCILKSKDDGETWSVAYREKVTSTKKGPGIICAGHFTNGECVCSRSIDGNSYAPLVISEGYHSYNAEGAEFNGIYKKIQ